MAQPGIDNTRAEPNAFTFTQSVTIKKPVADVFEYLMKDVNTRSMALEKDQAVEVSETDKDDEASLVDNQQAPNRMEVIKVVPNRLIHVSFSPGDEGARFVGEISGSYDLKDAGRGETRLTLTQVIKMSSRWMKLLGTLVGARKLMAAQLGEELNVLKSEIEKGGVEPGGNLGSQP